MMLSIYAILGVFLLLATRSPSRNRSLIAFTAWSSLAHAALMAIESRYDTAERVHLLSGPTIFGIIGLTLITLAPEKLTRAEASDELLSKSRSPEP